MTKNELNHANTPPELQKVNNLIVEALAAKDPQDLEGTLLQIMCERDAVVQHHLASLSESSARDFAEKELPVNEKLVALVQTLRAHAKDDVTHLVRSQVAINKYK